MKLTKYFAATLFKAAIEYETSLLVQQMEIQGKKFTFPRSDQPLVAVRLGVDKVVYWPVAWIENDPDAPDMYIYVICTEKESDEHGKVVNEYGKPVCCTTDMLLPGELSRLAVAIPNFKVNPEEIAKLWAKLSGIHRYKNEDRFICIDAEAETIVSAPLIKSSVMVTAGNTLASGVKAWQDLKAISDKIDKGFSLKEAIDWYAEQEGIDLPF